MARSVDFVIDPEIDGLAGVEKASLEALAGRGLAGEGVSPELTLTVLMTGDETLRALNRRFLGIDAPTDVLAFPEASEAPLAPDEQPSLGEIAISVPTAERQASALGHSLGDELAHLLVHGILHLCGYDHEDGDGEAARMRAREERYLDTVAAHAAERP